KKKNAVVLGISPDNCKSHAKFIDKHKLAVKLLADPEKKIIEAYGVWKKKKFMGKEYLGVERSTFLIKDGKIVKEWRSVSAKGHAEEVLKTLTQ
ncbi:MAG: peroxiredoxin, partial [Candidatus Woesearchaeota archaeon]